MIAKRQCKWAVLGAVHLDFVCEISDEFIANTRDSQTWLNWKITSGGVAGNIARHLDEAGLRSLLFALPGSGSLAQLATSLALKDLSSCELVALPGRESVGLVCLLYVKGAQPRRLVIGPERAQVDVTRYTDIREQILSYKGNVCGLFVDGYLLRRRVGQWVSDLEAMASDGWRVHLEFVPHDIWKQLSSVDFGRLANACTSISSSLCTIERILGLVSESWLDPMNRATS